MRMGAAEHGYGMDAFDKAVAVLLASGCIGSVVYGMTHLQRVPEGSTAAPVPACEVVYNPVSGNPMSEAGINAAELLEGNGCAEVPSALTSYTPEG